MGNTTSELLALARSLSPAPDRRELDMLVIQGTVVSAEHVSTTVEPLNLKTFIRSLAIPVIVGGCATYKAALHLMRTGAAGVLVGYTGDFKEKVVLAKIGKAIFHRTVRPGFAIRFTAKLERFDVSGAATRGHVDWIDPATGDTERMAEITLMFSHIDRNRSNLQFPEHNFVFTGQLMEMIQVSGVTDARVYDAPQNPVTL